MLLFLYLEGVDPYMMNWQGSDSTSLSANIYEVIIADANNCIDTIDVEVSQPTEVVATSNTSQTPFIASASGGTPPYTFEWLYFGNYQSSGTTFDPSESNGDYTLVAIDANDCEGREPISVYNTVGVSEIDELEVLIYPNPVGDYFNIEIKSETNSEDFTFKLLDDRGRVLSQDLFKKSIQIDRKNISPGVYFIQLNSASNFIQRKIIFSEKK